MNTKHKTQSEAFLLAAVLLCLGWMTGCSDASASSAADSTSSESSASDVEVQEDTIGEVSYVGSTFFSVNTYTADTATEDYTDIALSDLTEAGSTAYIYFDSDTEFYTVESGALVSAADDDVTEGAMIAETTADDGTQQIIILAAGETQESIDAEIAEVTAVDGDTLTLTVYALAEDAADYEITDAADIDLSNYEASSETDTHTLLSTDVIQVSEDGSAVSADSSEIAVGDKLAIYTDSDSGYTTLVVYHSDTV